MTVALILSGGGAHGAFEAGVARAVAEAGIEPSLLSGTSAGALNAAGLAVGFSPDELADLWLSVDTTDVYRLRRDVHRLLRAAGLLRGSLAERALASIGWTYLLETAPLARTLRRILGNGRLRLQPGTTLVVSAVEQRTGDLVRFASAPPPQHRLTPRFRVGPIDVGHLLASTAIPLAFPPGRVDGMPFWDGGIVANTPLAPALAYEPDRAIVVTTATRTRPAREPRSLGEALSLLIDNLIAHSLKADLEHARTVNRLCSAAPEATDRKVVDLLVVEPTGLELGNGFDFSPQLARRRIDAGLEVGRRALEAWLVA